MVSRTLDDLVDLALDHHGYVRAQDARGRGIAGSQLRKLAASGRLEHVAHGLYRVAFLPRNANDEYAEASLWASGRGVISHSSALALHQLCDVNPSRLHVTVPASYVPRRTGGELYRIWRRTLPAEDITTVDDIPVVTPARAVMDALSAGEDPGMLRQAIRTARSRGDITSAQAARLRRAVRASLAQSETDI